MTWRDWLEWTPTIISALIAISIIAGKTWLRSRIENSVKHAFDQKIESVRADLRLNEERLKSELRSKEAEIAALRDGLLSGLGQRQASIDRRRLDAVERLWARVSTGLVAYKTVATTMGIINFDSVAKRTPNDANLRKFFELIISHIPENDIKAGNVSAEEIFLSPLAWAYFSAYQLILYLAYSRAKLLALGVRDPSDMLDFSVLRETLKAALPHQSEYIDVQPVSSYHYLLDELEGCIRDQLRSMLEGRELDRAAIARAGEIMAEVNKVQATINQARTPRPGM